MLIILENEAEEQFLFIQRAAAERYKWQKIPTSKEIINTAIKLLYEKEASSGKS